MDFIKSSDAVFFGGAVVIIFGVIWFIYDEIKEDENVLTEILWEEHKEFIIVSILIMILGVFIWRIIYLLILNHLDFFKNQYLQTLSTIQKIING